jgi:hypothetical protein
MEAQRPCAHTRTVTPCHAVVEPCFSSRTSPAGECRGVEGCPSLSIGHGGPGRGVSPGRGGGGVRDGRMFRHALFSFLFFLSFVL